MNENKRNTEKMLKHWSLLVASAFLYPRRAQCLVAWEVSWSGEVLSHTILSFFGGCHLLDVHFLHFVHQGTFLFNLARTPPPLKGLP